MAEDHTMIHWLARVARELRDQHNQQTGASRWSQKEIAAYVPGRDGPVDVSTVSRFEKGEWPTDPDAMLAAYALMLGADVREIWAEALRRFRECGPVPPRPERVPTRAERAEALARELDQRRQRRNGGSPAAPISIRRRRAGGG